MITYDFHPEVARDLDEIWEFIAADNPEAADMVIAEIVDAIDALVGFPNVGIGALTLRHALYDSFWYVNT